MAGLSIPGNSLAQTNGSLPSGPLNLPLVPPQIDSTATTAIPAKTRKEFFGRSIEELEAYVVTNFGDQTVQAVCQLLLAKIEPQRNKDPFSHVTNTTMHVVLAAMHLELKSVTVRELFSPEFTHDGKRTYQNILLKGTAFTLMNEEQVQEADQAEQTLMGFAVLKVEAAREAVEALRNAAHMRAA